MPTMKNPETGEAKEMSMEELMEAMREGRITVQQQVHHADGKVTSSTIYGNDVGDGIDRSLNIFGTMGDIFAPALQKAKKIKEADANTVNLFCMDNSDVNYEVTIDDTSMPIMHIVSCTKEHVTVSRYTRDERKTVGEPIANLDLLFDNGKIQATLEEVKENNLALFAFSVYELRHLLREGGILQELQRIGNKGSGVVITTDSEGNIDARVVRGKARPDLPCMLFGGLFAQGPEDAVMMRPYVDELITDALYDDMSLDEKIEAAEEGNTDLMEELAMYYLDGYDEAIPEKAAYWMKKLAEAGSSDGMFNTGLIYAKGHGVERDFVKALEWMKKAEAAGDIDAALLIEQFESMIENLKLAEAGNADSQAIVARLYTQLAGNLEQHGPEDDFKESFYWAEKSAAQNNAEGLYILALCYEHGRGTRRNGKRSAKYYQEAADLGHTGARFNLACYYMNGTYVEQDQERAFKMSLQSAEEGYALAMRAVGSAYQFGNGVQDDMQLAIQWYEKALEAEYDPELARKVELFKMLEETENNLDSSFEDGMLPDGYEDALKAFNAEDNFVYNNSDIEFKGKNFVLTSCDNEMLIEKIIKERGGVIRSSTVLDTDYLIYGEPYGMETKKYERALELIDRGKNIKLLSEREFFSGGQTASGDGEGCVLCLVEGDQVKCWVQNIKVIRSSIPLEEAKLIFELYNVTVGEYAKIAEKDEDFSYAGLSGLVDEIKQARKLMKDSDIPKPLMMEKMSDDDAFEDRGKMMAKMILKYPKRYGCLKKYNIGYWEEEWENIFGEPSEEYFWIDMMKVTKEQYYRYASELHHVYKVAEIFAPGELPFDLNDEDTVSIFGTGKFEAFADFSYGC